MKLRAHFIGMLTLLMASWLVPSAYSRAESAAEQLVAAIQADYATLQRARDDLQQLSDSGSLTPAAIRDYHDWIQQLSDRVVRACQQLRRAGSGPRQPVACDAPHNTLSAASIDTATEQTRTEQTGTLQRQLDQSIGEFDEKLLREQERVKAATPAGGQAGGADAGQPGTAGSVADAARGDAGDRQGEQNETHGQETTTTSKPRSDGSKGKPGGYSTPADIPDGSDDDVVARQIREAAEQESDPELRKKLWEEYRRYKAGIR